jgi:hypothetical protein
MQRKSIKSYAEMSEIEKVELFASMNTTLQHNTHLMIANARHKVEFVDKFIYTTFYTVFKEQQDSGFKPIDSHRFQMDFFKRFFEITNVNDETQQIIMSEYHRIFVKLNEPASGTPATFNQAVAQLFLIEQQPN